MRDEKKSYNEKELTWFDEVITASLKDPTQALRLVQERKDLDPELRSSVVNAITHGSIDTHDDAATMLALQDRIFGDSDGIELSEFAIEVGKGNLRRSH